MIATTNSPALNSNLPTPTAESVHANRPPQFITTMATYHASSRANFFRVKDAAKFLTWAERHGVTVHRPHRDGEYFTMMPDDSDSGTFPNIDPDSDEEIDFPAELATHLHEDSVAVILETGAEKLRYLHGHAIAINAQGETVQISLHDIYTLAVRRFPGKEVTRAEY